MIDWTALGLLLDGLGAVLVLGTDLNIIRYFFKNYHPECQNAMMAMFNMQLGMVSRHDEYFNTIKDILNTASPPKKVVNENPNQVVVIDYEGNLVVSISFPDVVPEDWPDHSERELRSNIYSHLRDEKDIDILDSDVNPFGYFAASGSVIKEIGLVESDQEKEVHVRYVLDIPDKYEYISNELPILRTEKYRHEIIRFAYNDYVDKIIMKTGGLLLAVGFAIQLISRQSIQSIITSIMTFVVEVVKMILEILGMLVSEPIFACLLC